MRVAVFGGSFNPPHVAHVFAVTYVLTTHEVDRVLVCPTHIHALGKELESFEDRMLMAELAMGWIPGVRVSRVEGELGGESRTLRLLTHLQAQNPDWKMRFVMGSDLLAQTAKWHRFDEVERLAPPIIVGRQGYEDGSAMLPSISSTKVREMVASGRWNEAERLVPRPVLDYMRARGLYSAAQ